MGGKAVLAPIPERKKPVPLTGPSNVLSPGIETREHYRLATEKVLRPLPGSAAP